MKNKKEYCYKIADEVLRKECRIEAKELIDLSDEKILDEIVEYYEKKQPNIVCLVFDHAVDVLVKNKNYELKMDCCFKGFPKFD